MDKLINELICGSLGHRMDESRNVLLAEDDIYINDNKDLEDLERRYNELKLSDNDKRIINDYIACLDSVNSRYADLSYIAGVTDTVKLLNSLDLLKEYEDKK